MENKNNWFNEVGIYSAEPTMNDLYSLLLELTHDYNSKTWNNELKKALISVPKQKELFSSFEIIDYALSEGLLRSGRSAKEYFTLFASLIPLYDKANVEFPSTDKLAIALFGKRFGDILCNPDKPINELVELGGGIPVSPVNEIPKYFDQFYEIKEAIEERVSAVST